MACLGQATEGNRPPRHLNIGDAVLPVVPSFPGEMINRPGREEHGRTIKTVGVASSKPECRRRPERDPDDMLEHWSVPMPPDPGTRVVAYQQGLEEFVRIQSCESRCLLAKR